MSLIWGLPETRGLAPSRYTGPLLVQTSYPPLDKNETALHCQEGRFCHLLHEKRGLLRSLSGDEKGGQHWRKTVCLVSDAVCPPTPCLSEFRFSHATHRLFGRSDRFIFTCLLVPTQVPPLAP